MKEPTIHNEDPNLEHNLLDTNYLKYKGKLFTGTLLYDDTNPVSYIEYTNGDYDGDNVSYHNNGQVAAKSKYKEGKFISGEEWYDNGQSRYNSDKGNIIFDKDGIITKENNVWYYKNGKVRLITEDTTTKIYSERGNLVILIEPSEGVINSYPTSRITYYHKILKEEYKNLTEHIYLYPEDNFNFRNSIFVFLDSWIIELYRANLKKEALQLINMMINDSEERLKENLHYRIQSLEQNFVHNSKIFIKRLINREFDDSNPKINNKLSIIILADDV